MHGDLPLTPLSMAILLALAEGDLHGYALMQEVEQQTHGVLTPGTGTLYAALKRLMDDGLIRESAEGEAEPGTRGRPRRSYGITAAGRLAARAEAQRMLEVVNRARELSLAPELAPEARGS